MAAYRLHLPLPPSTGNSSSLPPVPITHVYHNADPIPQGSCTGVASACAQAGYALETRCHLGKSIVYDTVQKFGWHVDVRKHVIKEVILEVLDHEGDWPDEDGFDRAVPVAREEEDCVVSVPGILPSNFIPLTYLVLRTASNGNLDISRIKTQMFNILLAQVFNIPCILTYCSFSKLSLHGRIFVYYYHVVSSSKVV
jgi:hypothetical protein